jgi:hypothetical protein
VLPFGPAAITGGRAGLKAGTTGASSAVSRWTKPLLATHPAAEPENRKRRHKRSWTLRKRFFK